MSALKKTVTEAAPICDALLGENVGAFSSTSLEVGRDINAGQGVTLISSTSLIEEKQGIHTGSGAYMVSSTS